MDGGEAKVILNEEGSSHHSLCRRSYEDGEMLAARVARGQSTTNSKNTIYSIKRFMGRRHNEIGEELKMVPYKSSHTATA